MCTKCGLYVEVFCRMMGSDSSLLGRVIAQDLFVLLVECEGYYLIGLHGRYKSDMLSQCGIIFCADWLGAKRSDWSVFEACVKLFFVGVAAVAELVEIYCSISVVS